MSDADEMLEAAKANGTPMTGQSMPQAKLDKATAALAERAQEEHQLEAAAFTEEIVRWLNAQWNDREFTAEQRVFSLSLAAVNFRNHFPAERGGKEFFDKISKTAWEYFAANSA